MSAVRVSSMASFDDVDPDEWNALVPRGHTATVFQTWQWHQAWWQVYGEGGHLRLFVARRDGELLGALAMCQGADRTLRFVGHGRSDYLDVIGGEDSAVRAALWQAALWQGASLPALRWRRLDLRYVPSDSPTLLDLKALGFPLVPTQEIGCATLRLQQPEDAGHVLRKKSVRRHHGWFQKQEHAAVEHLTTAVQIEPYLDVFFDQHVRRWRDTPSPSLFENEQHRRFFRVATHLLDGTGWLCFTRLAVRGDCVACHFGMRFGGRLLWYKPSFDVAHAKHSPGEAMIAELVTYVQREQLEELDFTVGDEAFKQRFTNHVRHNVNLTVFRSTLDHLSSLALRKAKSVAKAVVGRATS